ncbi:MAG: hypothetical protein ACK5RL_13385 [Acidimicrobiales bacterium]
MNPVDPPGPAALAARVDRPHPDPATAPTLVVPPDGPSLAPPGPGRPWRDVHRLVVVAPGPGGGPVTVATQVSVRPDGPSASFVAMVTGLGDRPVVLSELHLAAPRHGLEVRGSGLWAAHNCEDPFVHWSYGLEAFALVVDEPDELLGRGLGERIALGWELELETAGPAEVFDAGGYHQAGRGHGVVLVGHDEIELDGPAVRTHAWGRRRVPGDGVLDDGTPGQVTVALPDGVDVWSVTSTAAGVRTGTGPL